MYFAGRNIIPFVYFLTPGNQNTSQFLLSHGCSDYRCSTLSLSCILQGSGCDEIVGCAWDGMTYIVDQQRNVVKYHVGENICAFCAGENIVITHITFILPVLISGA